MFRTIVGYGQAILAGLSQAAGWVLPLDHDGERWFTGEWQLPDGDDLILFPGDSPIGLRLPLGQLPEDALRRGLTVELRGDDLIVFLPPLPSFALFAELVRAIEKLVTELDLPPIRLEGYTPPGDADLESIALTSDPGVLEVNLPPAASWPDFERDLRGLFDCAQAVRMRSFKYQISGRKISTGGGAHIVLGGPDLDHNPFIKRPRCSAVSCGSCRIIRRCPMPSAACSPGRPARRRGWTKAPSSCPTNWKSRCRHWRRCRSQGSPGMIDALLRNLLMDWNGNTHRAEAQRRQVLQ